MEDKKQSIQVEGVNKVRNIIKMWDYQLQKIIDTQFDDVEIADPYEHSLESDELDFVTSDQLVDSSIKDRVFTALFNSGDVNFSINVQGSQDERLITFFLAKEEFEYFFDQFKVSVQLISLN